MAVTSSCLPPVDPETPGLIGRSTTKHNRPFVDEATIGVECSQHGMQLQNCLCATREAKLQHLHRIAVSLSRAFRYKRRKRLYERQ